VSPLDRKLLRDLRRLWLQAVAVGIVLGCGIAIFVMATGMYGSLEASRDQYYARSLMADLAGSLVRAPDRIAVDLAAVPGVAGLEARASGVGLLTIEGVIEPVSARLISLPADRRPRVNDLVLKRGRWPEAARSAEVLVNEAFAEAHAIEPGLRLPVLIRGQRKTVEVVGIASSPEFVFAVAPGDILPEPRRFGVLWMNREALGSALDLDGAFNDVVLRLQADADRPAVIASIDAQLARFGGRGLYGRDRMLSARYLSDELSQLRTLASILPPIFLMVAVFLINVMLSRLVATERANIGLLKAFGYANATIGSHYAKFALAFCLGAAVLGIVGEPGFLAEVNRKAGLFRQGLEALVAAHPDVFESVWGSGLMLGLKCKVAPAEVVKAGYGAHVLTVPAADNVVRLLPALNIPDSDIAEALARLDRAAAMVPVGAAA